MLRIVRFSLPLLAILFIAGCMDGPFYAIKRINPYYHAQWSKDRKLGKTYEQRLKELNQFESQWSSLGPTEQTEWSERLAEIVENDASPELRIRAIRGLSQIDSAKAITALNVASRDDVEKVRLAACQAWQTKGGDSARDMLLSLASKDESTNVRQAAVDGLAQFQDPQVMQSLGKLLEDKSPAVVYMAAQSLEKMTGEDFGGDVKGWQDYLAARQPASQTNPLGPDAGLPNLPNLGIPDLPNAGSPIQTASGSNGLPQN